MWSLSSWLRKEDEAVVGMQEPLLASDGPGGYTPPLAPASCLDRRGSHHPSEHLPISTQPSSHLMSFSRPATPDASTASEHDEPASKRRLSRAPARASRHDTTQAAACTGFSSPMQAAHAPPKPRQRHESNSENEARFNHMAVHAEGPPGMAAQAQWRGSWQHGVQEHSGLCRQCRADSFSRRPSRELIGAARGPRYSQEQQRGFPGRAASLSKDQVMDLPPSPFSILHDAQHELLRSASFHDEAQEHVYSESPRRSTSTPREACSPANSRRSSMLSRIGSHQAALQEQAQDSMQSMHSVGSQGLSWVPVMHPGAQPGGVPSLLQPPSSQQARDAMRLWHGALKWVALWLVLSVLTLLHAAGLVHAMSNVSVAKVCAGLFCWTGVLGLAGSCKGLLSEHLVRHRSDAVAAANSLGLKSVSVLAFMSAVLSGLACLVHAFVLQLVSQQDPHLPPCDPSVPICAETYNLLLVLMVATMTMYGAHGGVSAIVAHRAHHARQVLRNGSVLHF